MSLFRNNMQLLAGGSNESEAECDYYSWQKSFYIASSTEFLAAMFFLATGFFVVKDWDKAIKDEKGELIQEPE